MGDKRDNRSYIVLSGPPLGTPLVRKQRTNGPELPPGTVFHLLWQADKVALCMASLRVAGAWCSIPTLQSGSLLPLLLITVHCSSCHMAVARTDCNSMNCSKGASELLFFPNTPMNEHHPSLANSAMSARVIDVSYTTYGVVLVIPIQPDITYRFSWRSLRSLSRSSIIGCKHSCHKLASSFCV